jgi:uncharacterized protein (UPF0264 family)
MTELLVSVRTAPEARIALAAGVDLLDVKEPERGSLGRADDGVLQAVLDSAAGQTPVSAALGELRDWPGEQPPLFLGRLAFVKWGLSGDAKWATRTARLRRRVEETSPCRVVLAAYADHERAGAPAPREVCRHACRGGFSVLLIDTCHKDGTSLLDWLPLREAAALISSCHDAGVRVALAGGLRLCDVELLGPLRPDWFAVRGAACAGGARGATLDPERTRLLVELVRSL